ncbi:MAG: potassium channel protein [Candidatus Dadabacteria bacterium]|nr:potassium channel protein [Candidatus Dadabacteria bacterium]
MKKLGSKMISYATLIVFIIVFGTLGYMVIEDWNLLDSLYMTVITITTVGYKEVHDLSSYGVVFTIVLLIGGVGIILYVLGSAARLILEGELQEVIGRRRLEKKINELKDQYIICGYGRMGKIICKELRDKGISYVVVEKNPILSNEKDVLIFQGDATSDETLKKVGVERARGLVSVLPTDAENLFVVLSARELNPNLLIVARASDEGAEQKMLRAGADRVVSPYYIGGLKIAHIILKPAVMDFIEFATKSGNIELQMEEITVKEGSRLGGLELDECGIGKDLGIIVVAIKKPTGRMEFSPTSKSIIQIGDTLIALGEISKLKTLEGMAKAL